MENGRAEEAGNFRMGWGEGATEKPTVDDSPYFIIFHFKLTLRKYYYFLHFSDKEMEAQKIKYFTQYLSQ